MNCSNILDVGCGVAGLDYFLYCHYNNDKLQLDLLDKTHINRNVYYGYKSRGAFYNSLDLAKELLISSGIPPNNIHLHEATMFNDINVSCKFDLVVSLLSWGFHYPVETYLDRVYDLLRGDGVLIMDIRKGSNGIHVLQRKFNKINIIFEQTKFYRVCTNKIRNFVKPD
jgi:SAM-dependent methyltransferase